MTDEHSNHIIDKYSKDNFVMDITTKILELDPELCDKISKC